MIIIIVAVFLVLTYLSWFFIQSRILRWICGVLTLLLLFASLVLMTGNFAWHWGMKEVTHTKTQKIYTAGEITAAYGILVKHEIGNASGNYVFVYRTDQNQKKVGEHFVPDEHQVLTAVKKTATYQIVSTGDASVKTVTTQRVFSSDLMKLLFGVGGGNHELVQEKSVISVPKDSWMVVTDQQAKELTEKAPELKAQAQLKAAQIQAELKAQAAASVKMAVEKAVAQAPAYEAAVVAATAQKKAEAQAQIQLKQKAAQLEASAKNPKNQIAQIKNWMGWK